MQNELRRIMHSHSDTNSIKQHLNSPALHTHVGPALGNYAV